MPRSTEPRQSLLNRAWMGMVNAMAPGTPFNTHTSGGAGNAWRAGDYANFNSNPYARARVLLGAIPGVGGALGEYGATLAENRHINSIENSPNFYGPPRDYDSTGASNNPPGTALSRFLSNMFSRNSQPSSGSNPDADEAARQQAMKDDFNSKFKVTSANNPYSQPSYLPSFGASTGGGKGFGWANGDPSSLGTAAFFSSGPQFTRGGGGGSLENAEEAFRRKISGRQQK